MQKSGASRMKIKKIAEKTELFLFDMDGTIYLGDELFSFTPELLKRIKEVGKRYLYLTNNSSKGKLDYVKKLESLGIEASADEFLTSTEATCHYIKKNLKNICFFVCGTESLKTALRDEGIKITESENEASGVLMGFDTELTFKKLEIVSRLLTLNPDMPYIATNPDFVCPTEWGSVPDCGSVSEMIKNATGRMPKFIGKPEPLMVELAAEKLGVKIENTAVIGDRIYTDIKSALNAGAAGVLVMSGETTEEILKNSPDTPTVVIPDAGEFLKYL